MSKEPRVNSAGERELAKCETQFDKFQEEVSSLTLDRMNMAPKQDVEPQTKLSHQEVFNSKDIYLKPYRQIRSKEPFNEDFRKDYNFQKEYVYFIAENREIIGEEIDIWTKPFAGLPAEEWKVPVNKPVWGPRYLAEQIKGCKYHRLTMQQSQSTGGDQMGTYYGTMVADSTIQRLDAIPANQRKSVFMGATNF